MHWKQFWEKLAEQPSLYKQVARSVGPNLLDEEHLYLQAKHVKELLKLNGKQLLLDVCCGNGLFTSQLKSSVKKIVAIDFSEPLIAIAKEHYPDITFEYADALNLPKWEHYQAYFKRFDTITICFSFQYFDSFEKGFSVISYLEPLLKNGGYILITDVPDLSKFFSYYNTAQRLISLVKQFFTQKNVMGKFWSKREMAFICAEHKLLLQQISQPVHFPYANYRCDYLIFKP